MNLDTESSKDVHKFMMYTIKNKFYVYWFMYLKIYCNLWMCKKDTFNQVFVILLLAGLKFYLQQPSKFKQKRKKIFKRVKNK